MSTTYIKGTIHLPKHPRVGIKPGSMKRRRQWKVSQRKRRHKNKQRGGTDLTVRLTPMANRQLKILMKETGMGRAEAVNEVLGVALTLMQANLSEKFLLLQIQRVLSEPLRAKDFYKKLLKKLGLITLH